MPAPLQLELPGSLGSSLFLDVEASGLHAGSYPIEVGQGWLSRLFRHAGVKQAFTLQDASVLEALAAELSGLHASEAHAFQEQVGHHYPHSHRAAMDARRAAALLLAIAIPDAVDAIIAAA